MIPNYRFNKHIILRTPSRSFQSQFKEEDLKLFFSTKENLEALYLSSPSLYGEYIAWTNDLITDQSKKDKLFITLLKYAIRMSVRCTPFGLLASCSTLEWGNENLGKLGNNLNRKTRIDMLYLAFLSFHLSKLPVVKSNIKYYTNDSMLISKDKIKYIEYFYKNSKRVHSFSLAEKTVYLATIIEAAKHGRSIEELSILLSSDDITKEEAQNYIEELIEAQILNSELIPSVTGEDFFVRLLNKLREIEEQTSDPNLRKILGYIESIKEQLNTLDKNGGNDISSYEKIIQSIEELNVTFEKNRLFQVDLFKDVKNGKINQQIQKKIEVSIRVLNKLTGTYKNNYMENFKQEFKKRYQLSEVSLIQVLDDEYGIGYTSGIKNINPLLAGVYPINNNDFKNIKWDKLQSFLLKKITLSISKGDYVVNIQEEEINQLEANWDDLPDSLSVPFSILDNNSDDPLILIHGVGGDAANLLARFSYANKNILNAVEEIITNEHELVGTDTIHAEIVHLPQNRTGNVIKTPVLRGYEIPYMTKSDVSEENQIHLDDIYVSVRNNEVYLRSKNLGKKIIPCFTNAYNFRGYSSPIFRFLCDIRNQNKRQGLYFHWGLLGQEFKFLPRVEVDKNVIIHLATWQLIKEDYKILLEKNINILAASKQFQQQWNLPDLILFKEGDNKLLINLKEELSIKMFISVIKKSSEIVLTEFLYNKDQSMIRDIKGDPYTNELLISLSKEKTEEISSYKNWKPILQTCCQRNFSIGSEWLYYNIYCGIKTADDVLSKIIKPLKDRLFQDSLIDSWFFIRYQDTNNHLRIRFHLTNTEKINVVIGMFHNAIMEYEQLGLIWRNTAEVYQREIERYGDSTIELSEKLFYYDSDFVVNFLDKLEGEEKEDLRWQFAIISINQLLEGFNYSQTSKMMLMESLKKSYAKEYNLSKSMKLGLDKSFRNKRKVLTLAMNNYESKQIDYPELHKLVLIKSKGSQPLIDSLLEKINKGDVTPPLDSLLRSYIHMFINRMFREKQNLHEMVIYDFMWRVYRSEIAKEKTLRLKEIV